MGNSAPAPPLTAEQQDLQFLGERYPFGDAELRHLYRAYRRLRLAPLSPSQSPQPEGCACGADFLVDYGVHCGHAPGPLRAVVVADGLPRRFGNALFRAAFCAAGDVTVYHRDDGSDSDDNNTINSGSNGPPSASSAAAAASATVAVAVDEHTRRARLEQFFEGLAACSRRGSRAALAVLFRTARELAAAEPQQQQQQQQQREEAAKNATTKNDAAAAATTTTIDMGAEDRVSARKFVEIGYRLSLAVAYLQKAKEEEEKEKQEQDQKQQSAEENFESETDKQDETTSADEQAVDPDAASSDPPPPPSSSKQQNQNHHNHHHHAADDNDDRSLAALAQSLVEKGRRRRQRSGLMPGGGTAEECPHLRRGRVELADVLEWSEHVAPLFASLLPTLFQHLLFPHQASVGGTRTLFDAPCIDPKDDNDNDNNNDNHGDVTSSFFRSSASARLFGLACMSPALTGRYCRLYTSAADGLSFNRLQNAVLGYGGPTLLLVRSTSGGIFGAFTATTWKESKDFYGNTDCFLYQLQPATAVYRPTGSERHYMYCNSAARSKGYDQQAHGIGFGGTVHEPRLFLAETLDDCVAAATDLTFENGRLLPELSTMDNNRNSGSSSSNSTQQQQQQHRKYFAVDSLEVWGVGGTAATRAALEQRAAARARTGEALRRARRVDKAQFLDDFRAGTFSSKAFRHRQEADGRANDDMDERCRDQDRAYEYA